MSVGHISGHHTPKPGGRQIHAVPTDFSPIPSPVDVMMALTVWIGSLAEKEELTGVVTAFCGDSSTSASKRQHSLLSLLRRRSVLPSAGVGANETRLGRG